jgi:O-antigen/teichoic acid export membrane protein
MAGFRRRARRIWSLIRGPTALTTTGNLVILAGNAVSGVVSARALGPAGRGQLAVVVLWSALIHLVGSLGLQSSCSYYAARWPDRRAGLAAWAWRAAAWQAAAMTVASVFVLGWLTLRLRLPPPLAAEFATWAAAGTITLYGVTYAQGCGDFGRFNAIRVISTVLPAALMLAGATVLRLTPAEAGAAYLVPVWFTAVLAAAWLRRAKRAGNAAAGVLLSRRERRCLWSYGWRSLASLSSMMLNNSSDQMTLGLLVPASFVGVYAVAASVASPLTAVLASLGAVGLPTVASLSGRAQAAATWQALRRAATFLVFAAPPLALLLPRAIPLVYGARYAAAVVPAEILLMGAAFAALASVTDDLLRGHGHPGFVSITQGAGGVLTVAGILLLGGHSLAGVALVSSAGFAVSFALALVRLRAAARKYGPELPFSAAPDQEPAAIRGQPPVSVQDPG